MLVKAVLAFLLLVDVALSTRVSEIKKLIEQCKSSVEKESLDQALHELQCALDYAPFFYEKNKYCKRVEDFEDSTDPPEEYDFIVAGGGVTGTIMARRLSEEPNFNVLLIGSVAEANELSKVPVLAPYLFFTNNSYILYMEPQKNAGYALEDRRVVMIYGAAIGGSSVIQSGVVSRVPNGYFESWGGDWCSAAAKYFIKSEKANITGAFDAGNHNYDGPLLHADAYLSPLGKAFVQCGAENGLPEIDDTGIFQSGVCRVKSVIEKGRKQNYAQAFLDGNTKNRKNLIMKNGGFIYKVLINEKNRAYGIQYISNYKKYTALARKEVILGIGCFQTPQILMLSGIGPKEHLEELGIKCLKDLPVGKTLHDVISYIGLMYEVNSHAPTSLDDLLKQENIDLLLNEGVGPLASSNSIESSATVQINSNIPNVKIQLVNRGWALDGGKALRKTVGISKKFYDRYFKELEGKRMINVVPIIPGESSGKIRLQNTNHFDAPLIYGCYYDDPKDRETMISAIKYTMEFMKCESFKKFNLTFYDKPVPGCEHKKGDKYYECIIKYLTVSYQDTTGSCKMGAPTDPTAVVDYEGKVIGIDGLRIIGGPIVPKSVPGGSTAVSTMMTEKTADDIKKMYGFSVPQFCK